MYDVNSYHFVRVQEPVNTLQVVPDHLPELTERHQRLVPQSRKEVIRAAKITLSLILGEPSLLHIPYPSVDIYTLLVFPLPPHLTLLTSMTFWSLFTLVMYLQSNTVANVDATAFTDNVLSIGHNSTAPTSILFNTGVISFFAILF